MEWEQIDAYHKRAQVLGGWLVKAYEDVQTRMHEDMPMSQGYEWRVSMCFVPDPNHEWEVGK